MGQTKTPFMFSLKSVKEIKFKSFECWWSSSYESQHIAVLVFIVLFTLLMGNALGK